MLCLTAMLQAAPTQFLALAEQVEGEEDDGVHDLARECSNHRREEMAGELGFRPEKKIGGENKKLRAMVRPGVFIGFRNVPRHTADRGGVDSSEEGVVLSCA
jgi:hypothetical protein